ncbi:MAG TPA: PfkB family carbohydrate kinase [Steroidobacteraceae bacterium]|nr:PfkB family carbohydrate kinase [Steroidobacteraceae bacterium]
MSDVNDKTFDLVTIGNYTKDTIVTTTGTRQVDGGGYSYAAHAAHLAGIRVGAVTRLAPEDTGVTEPLRGKGIAVFAHPSRQSTLMRLEYPTANVDERILTVAAVADPIGVEHVATLDSRAYLVSASVRGEVPLAVLQHLRARAELLALDVQGYVRVVTDEGRLKYEAWPEQGAVLGLVDVLKTDAVEAEFLTGETDLRAAADALAAFGPREIVLTHKDGLLVRADGEFYEAPFLPRPLRGRSGRGDTCVGSYASRRLLAAPAEATRWAAAVTTLKLEVEGPVRGVPADVAALLVERFPV